MVIAQFTDDRGSNCKTVGVGKLSHGRAADQACGRSWAVGDAIGRSQGGISPASRCPRS